MKPESCRVCGDLKRSWIGFECTKSDSYRCIAILDKDLDKRQFWCPYDQ
jgi:hypothetical protein